MTELERTTPTIEQRVAAGAEWLDANVPGWLDLINLAHLRLDDACRCILGQTFGDYDKAPLAGPEHPGIDAYDAAAWPLGFQSRVIALTPAELATATANRMAAETEYAALGVEWRRLILARREAGRV